MKRQAVGIWKCSACKKVIAGGAWTVSTTAAATVRRSVVFFALLCVMRANEGPLSSLARSDVFVTSQRHKITILSFIMLCSTYAYKDQ